MKEKDIVKKSSQPDIGQLSAAAVAQVPVLYKKAVITLADVGKKTIEVAWQFDNNDKKQQALLATIAARLKIISLDEFSGDLSLEKLPNGVYYVSGRWHGLVRQRCVVTLEEVSESLRGDVHLDFIEEQFYHAKKHKDAESLVGGKIDLLEQMVQELSLSLNPFPKKSDAWQTITKTEEAPPPATHKPFLQLAEKLKSKNRS